MGDHDRIRPHPALAPLGALDDELGGLEHRHVLLNRGERHVVRRREFRHRRFAGERPAQDVAPGRIAERPEEAIECIIIESKFYNHLVVR
ncbi:hypothetical protein GCM10010460_15070 [Microbacterium terrae]